MGKRTRWLFGILALALWVGSPYVAGQQQKHTSSSRRQAKRASRQRTQRTKAIRSGSRTPQISTPGVTSSGATATATRVPESGTPTVENSRPTGDLDTLPNQTLTPGATTVPSNAGGIAPASNDASSGEYTPSEGKAAPNTPGANPSNTQGVPTFSSGAQPLDANLPRTVSPGQGTAQAGQQPKKPH